MIDLHYWSTPNGNLAVGVFHANLGHALDDFPNVKR